jgi:hypothetical protein
MRNTSEGWLVFTLVEKKLIRRPNGNFFGELTNFGDLTILTNHFWYEFLVYILNHTFFEPIIFPGSMPGGAT